MEQNGVSFLFQKQRLIDVDKFEKLVLNHRASYLHKEDVIAALSKQLVVDAVELPVKLGQKVYTIPRSAIREWTVVGVWLSVNEECSYVHIYWEKNGHHVESRAVKFCDLDKVLYMTRKEAEAALAKMEAKK